MEVIRCWEEKGVTISEPYKRHIRVMLAPDKRGVTEISFNQALIYPGSKTDYHIHDRPELIYVVSGRESRCAKAKRRPSGRTWRCGCWPARSIRSLIRGRRP